MDINVLYFLDRLYALLESLCERSEDFSTLYSKMLLKSAEDIVSSIPEDIRLRAENLGSNYKRDDIEDFLSILMPYKKECEAFLPSLKDADETFTDSLKTEFCQNGYFFKDGVFRKVRKNRLYIIECELFAGFKSDDEGRVLGCFATPIVRVCDCRVKNKDGKYFLKQSGVNDDDATYTIVRCGEDSAFCKTLRHLECIELSLGEELTQEQIKVLSASASVASAVCENRAVPAYYKKLCKNDIPSGRAFSLALLPAILMFVLLSALIALVCGVLVYFIFGFKKIWGMFTSPPLYIISAILSVIYFFITYKKIKNGR